jgi:hypothetical protein
VVGTGGGNPRVLRDTFPQQFEFEEKPTLTFEQPFITVVVELDGLSGSQQLDNTAQLHFVTVTDLSEDSPLLAVSVEDLDLNPIVIRSESLSLDPVTVNIEDFRTQS